MRGQVHGFRPRARAQAEELIATISVAESAIVSTIERECEALRAGSMLAASALHARLTDAARLYLAATDAARASIWTIEQVLPGTRQRLEEQRAQFADLLKVELAILAAQRAAAGLRWSDKGFEEPSDDPAIAPSLADDIRAGWRAGAETGNDLPAHASRGSRRGVC
jgi:hypothetical protein